MTVEESSKSPDFEGFSPVDHREIARASKERRSSSSQSSSSSGSDRNSSSSWSESPSPVRRDRHGRGSRSDLSDGDQRSSRSQHSAAVDRAARSGAVVPDSYPATKSPTRPRTGVASQQCPPVIDAIESGQTVSTTGPDRSGSSDPVVTGQTIPVTGSNQSGLVYLDGSDQTRPVSGSVRSRPVGPSTIGPVSCSYSHDTSGPLPNPVTGFSSLGSGFHRSESRHNLSDHSDFGVDSDRSERRSRSKRKRSHRSPATRTQDSSRWNHPPVNPMGFPWGFGSFPPFGCWDPRLLPDQSSQHPRDRSASPKRRRSRKSRRTSTRQVSPPPPTPLVPSRTHTVSKAPDSLERGLDDVLSIAVPDNDPLLLEHSGLSVDHPSDHRSGLSQNFDEEEEDSPQQFSLSAAIKVVFDTLPSDICPPPPVVKSSTITSATEAIFSKHLPEQLGPKTPPPVLPISPVVKECLEVLDKHNRASSHSPWLVPSKTFKLLHPVSAYRPPVPDASCDLHLDKVASLLGDAQRAGISRLTPSSQVSIPLSLLESWELRDRQTLGLASQIDYLAATTAQLVQSVESSSPDDLRQVVMAIAKSTKNLAANAASNLSESLRVRRSATLQTSKKLLDSSKASLLSAPLASGDLFGGLLPQVLNTDKDDQLHASAAAKSSSSSFFKGKRTASSSSPLGLPPLKKKQATSTFKSPPSAKQKKGSRGPHRQQTLQQNKSADFPKRSGAPGSGRQGQP